MERAGRESGPDHESSPAEPASECHPGALLTGLQSDGRSGVAMLLRLQATAGNRAVGRVLASANSARPRTRMLARTPPSDSLDLLGGAGSRYAAERARLAELEAAETGEGRQRTLTRLAAMADRDARREAPGIAYRAQDRGDVELATAASGRLLAAWLASADAPATLSAGFGPDDAVDIVLERADRALGDGRLALGGNFLAVAMVQLVRAARATVGRRPSVADPALQFLHDALLPLQQSDEQEVLQRVQRARELLDRHGRDVAARGNPAEIERFEAMAEAVHGAERRPGPAIAEDLGQLAPSGPTAAPTRARGATPAAETPPPRPEPTPQRPVSRAPESVVDAPHPELEGALVFHRTAPPARFGNIRSPRYGVAGTLAGARRLASELFGRTSSVIVEDVFARSSDGSSRQIRYLVLALTVRIEPPNPVLAEGDGMVGVENVEMLSRAASWHYFFLGITAGPWLFFQPGLLEYIQGVQASERDAGVEADTLDPESRRAAVFGPIDALIDGGDEQEAANQLTYVGAEGFALVDAATKTRYVATMLRAFTLEAHERTIVEVFRSVTSEDELRTILHGLQQAGVLRQLHADLQSAFPSLLSAVGEALRAPALTSARVRRLLRELRLLTVFPGVEVRADGSVVLSADIVDEFVAAVEALLDTLSSAVTGVIDILMDPQAFLEGLAKLVYFVVMADLASKGHPEAARYVSTVIDGVARQLGATTRGLAALQKNMPPDVEFVRGLQRSIEWRIVWEVLGMFVGVGEAIALVDAIRSGRAAAAVADLASGLSRTARAVEATEEAADAVRLAERGVTAAERETREAAEGARRAGHAADEVTTRDLAHGARLSQRPGGRRLLCINPCAELDHLSLSDDVIDAALRNISPAQTKDLVEVLNLYRRPNEIRVAQDLVNDLAAGGDRAAAAATRLEEIAALRRGASEGLPPAAGPAAPPHSGGHPPAPQHPAPPPPTPVQPGPPRSITAPPAHQYVLDPRTARTGGIDSIDVQLTRRNEAQVTITGRALPSLPQRMGFEDKLPLPSKFGLSGYDRAHLWARTLGDEAAEGVMYAPKAANVGLQEVLEHQIRGMAEHAGPGEHVVLRARATSYPRTEGGGALARMFEYDVSLVDDSGRVIERTGIRMEIPRPEELSRVGVPAPRIVPGGLSW